MGKCIDIGVQAVIEGVMMRAPESFVIAVRRGDKKIVLKKEKVKIGNNRLFKKPFLRGLIGLYNALILGIKALNFSAYHAMGEGTEKVTKKDIFVAMVLGVGFGVLLFVFLPLFLTEMLQSVIPSIKESFLVFNVVDGVIIFYCIYLHNIVYERD